MGEEHGDGHTPVFSPPPSKPHRGTPVASRLQSPTSHAFLLGSNDDQLERAQARAARAAAIRRKPSAPPPPAEPSADAVVFDRDQIMELYHNCVKLASENKINQKNTWELSLIDHLSEIIRVDSEDESETNFQKASCTLEAGVKIYSMRVDSVHSEAYKVLGGINRAGRGDEQDNHVGDDHTMAVPGDGFSKKDQERKISPLSTLEPSFESLNVKKFDVAFTVDPLYHQTSAQFDEGGAKGLLLNNLGVYGGCRVLFDSFEVPEISIRNETLTEQSELIDLSFLKDYIEQMMIHVSMSSDISPTLREISNLLNDERNRHQNISAAGETDMLEEIEDNIHNDFEDNIHNDFEDNTYDDYGPRSFDQDDRTNIIDDNSTNTNPNFTSHLEENADYSIHEPEMGENPEKIADFLSLGLGYTLKSNAWAGPDHWKYQKAKGLKLALVTENGPELAPKKNRKQQLLDIDFTKFLDKEMDGGLLTPPKKPKSLLLPANRLPCDVTLPEDCHYKPESLVSLFLLPHCMCHGKKRRKSSGSSKEADQANDSMASWEDEYDAGGPVDDGNAYIDVEDPGVLVSPPRQVNKVDIQYDKVSKQVDVHGLKETMWADMKQFIRPEMGCETRISFRQILECLPNDCPAASPNNISPHLFFICLLHLANEHCLSIRDHPSLDELDIHIPSAVVKKVPEW